MQEGSVGWDPVSINKPVTPLVRVYVALLFVILIVIVFRTIRLSIQLRRIKKLRAAADQEASERSRVCQHCHFELHSLKRWSAFTLQASLFVALVSAAEFLREVGNQKITAMSVLSRGISEICVQFAIGLFVVLVANAVTGYFEAALEGRALNLRN